MDSILFSNPFASDQPGLLIRKKLHSKGLSPGTVVGVVRETVLPKELTDSLPFRIET
ncbi:hypothetical protein [Desulfogranum japonicum]|uniref:hypothetical protein n=1 Tax=Desulfogranum japonicum TaxID=231447 RepID=UPI0003FF3A20|nr:hypothetical protein [Desulfogranum japonicum]